MLSFSTEFPLSKDKSEEDFFYAVKCWILDSPHTTFTEKDLPNFLSEGEFNELKGSQRSKYLSISRRQSKAIYLQNIVYERDLEWNTTLCFSDEPADRWVSVETYCESNSPTANVPEAKKPVIVGTLVNLLGGAGDGPLVIKSIPMKLTKSDTGLAADIISGTAGCYLPIIYISKSFTGTYIVDPGSLAHSLAGMAHVLIEPDRFFSRQLQILCDSQNAYGGTIGIYWPDAAGSRTFFPPRDFSSKSEIKAAIIGEVRAALRNRRSLLRCTPSVIENMAAKVVFDHLKESGSQKIEEWTAAFDSDIKVKEAEIQSLNQDNDRLKREVRRLEATLGRSGSSALRSGSEQELFPGEFSEVIHDALRDSLHSVPSDSRRAHIISAFINASGTQGILKEKKEKLKEILRDYTSMTRDVRSALQELGFSISDDGKHYKMTYEGDGRYTFSLAKTGSDFRGGLNAASDIAKITF